MLIIEHSGLFVLPRWQMLYSKIDENYTKRETIFSSTHLLNMLSISKNSARKIVDHLFNKHHATLDIGVQLFNSNGLNGKRKNLSIDINVPKKKYKISQSERSFEQNIYEAKGKVNEGFYVDDFLDPSVSTSTNNVDFFGTFESAVSQIIKPGTESISFNKPVSNTKIHIRRRLRKAVDVFYVILKNCQRNNFSYFLDKHCPLPVEKILRNIDFTSDDNKYEKNQTWSLLHFHTPVYNVFFFLRSILLQKLPTKIVWGSKQNELAFFKNLKMLLNCRRFDKITVNDFLIGIAITDIPWMSDSGPEAWQIFCKFLKWLLVDLIFLILKTFFYITEHANFRNRKEIWRNLVLKECSVLVNEEIWSCIDDEMHAQPQYFVRFCPKLFGLRPIMKQREEEKVEKLKNVMSSNELFRIFKLISKANPDLLGCAVQGRNKIHLKWKAFWANVCGKCRLTSDNVDLYFVKVDVDRCFDTIPVGELLVLIQAILNRSANLDISKLTSCFQTYSKVADVSDSVYSSFVGYLKNVTLDVMGKKFVKIKGIPQGWKLSPLLCNLFYGNLEICHLGDYMANKSNEDIHTFEVLMRFMDDYLFVTTCPNRALEFLRKMHGGFEKYGFQVNPRKTCINFALNDPCIHNAKSITVLDKNISFSWFGFLFPACALHPNTRMQEQQKEASNRGGVSLDLSRYFTVGNIRDCITVYPSGPEYVAFSSLGRSLKLRVTAICFDIKINNQVRILRNLYELAALAALQWLAHDFSRSVAKRYSCPGGTVLNIHRLAIVFVLSTIRKKLPGQKFPNRAMTLWVFLKAFLKCLRYHRNDSYKKIACRIKFGIQQQEKKLSMQKNWKFYKNLLRRAVAIFPQHLAKIKVCG